MQATPRPNQTRDSQLALAARGLHKSFGDNHVLRGVDLALRQGSVHALLGENGAGKSTLVKCVMGYHRPDAGRLLVDGNPVDIGSPKRAQALGIGMVYQHFTLVPNLSVAENLVLAKANLPFVIDWKAETAALDAFMRQTPFPVDPRAPVRVLSAGEKQKVEILKQLYLQSRIIILDEPTSVLTPAEADEVLGLLARMTREAGLSVLMITHKFREVRAFADEVTVLRKGVMAGGGRVADLSETAMAELMMGPSLPSTTTSATSSSPSSLPAPPAHKRSPMPHLRLDSVSANDDLGLPAANQVSFDVFGGEIVGIAAIAGNGQEELVEVLAGQRRATEGRIVVHGHDYTGTRAEIRSERVRCLPEEPLRNACVANMSVAENLALRDFDEPPHTMARVGLRPGRLIRRAEAVIADYGIRTQGPKTPIGQLSGGNVQRAVLARELAGDVALLIAANPCMGLDFKAVAEIHTRLRAARDRGAAVLLVSADLDEILALSDRILVMSEGRVAYETTPEFADVRVIGSFMAGHHEHKVDAA
ncbi:MAG TPA: ABC transporter ATP-binding protein [Polyangia bacterium]